MGLLLAYLGNMCLRDIQTYDLRLAIRRLHSELVRISKNEDVLVNTYLLTSCSHIYVLSIHTVFRKSMHPVQF